MIRVRSLLLALTAAILFSGFLVWWTYPTRADMASYAPAETMLYIESNDPSSILNAISDTQAWRLLSNTETPISQPRTWGYRLMRATGIGPIESVILARSQVSVIVRDVGITEDSGTLRIRPAVALIIDTHTSETRTRAVIEAYVRRLAVSTYGEPIVRRATQGELEVMEMSSPDRSRQIVAALWKTIVVIGNDRSVVEDCIDVAKGRKASLKDDSEFQNARKAAVGSRTLAFGYVPRSKSASLLSVTLPILLGHAPTDADFQKLISNASSKMFRSITWSCQPYSNGVEDKYTVSLDPSVVNDLKPTFKLSSETNRPPLLPETFHSVTYYRLSDPSTAWRTLRTALSSRVDTVSAVLFSVVLKSALLAYGITDPESFFKTVKGELVTFQFSDRGEQVMLIADVADANGLRALLTSAMRPKARDSAADAQWFEGGPEDTVALLIKDRVILGTSREVQIYHESLKHSGRSPEDFLRQVIFYQPQSASFPIVTYANDSDRVSRFAIAANALGLVPVPPANLNQKIVSLPFASTTTTLTDQGLERVTRSPLGQFSTLLPLMLPDRSNSNGQR